MFAQAVLEQTTANFRCNRPLILSLIPDPTPLTPESQKVRTDESPRERQTSASMTANSLNHQSSSTMFHSPLRRQNFAVEIPVRSSQLTPSSSVTSSGNKRQKIAHQPRPGSTSPTPVRETIEKDRVDGLVNQFSILLEDIFEAEDAFNPENEVPSEGSTTFFSQDSLKEDKPWLSREMHRKLDLHLRRLGKTIAAREGLRIDTGDLARITGICERAVKAAEMIDLKNVDDGDDELDAERSWVVGKLQKVENGILAANVIMLLIAGRGTDQQVTDSFECTDFRFILRRHSSLSLKCFGYSWTVSSIGSLLALLRVICQTRSPSQNLAIIKLQPFFNNVSLFYLASKLNFLKPSHKRALSTFFNSLPWKPSSSKIKPRTKK
jgi:hypothetical protein